MTPFVITTEAKMTAQCAAASYESSCCSQGKGGPEPATTAATWHHGAMGTGQGITRPGMGSLLPFYLPAGASPLGWLLGQSVAPAKLWWLVMCRSWPHSLAPAVVPSLLPSAAPA